MINSTILESAKDYANNSTLSLIYDVDKLNTHACLGGFNLVMEKLDEKQNSSLYMLVRHISEGINPDLNYANIIEDLSDILKNSITLESTEVIKEGRKATVLKFKEKKKLPFILRFPLYSVILVILRGVDREFHSTWTHKQKVNSIKELIYEWHLINSKLGHTINENIQDLFSIFSDDKKFKMEMIENFINTIRKICDNYNEDLNNDLEEIYNNYPTSNIYPRYHLGQTTAFNLLELYSGKIK